MNSKHGKRVARNKPKCPTCGKRYNGDQTIKHDQTCEICGKTFCKTHSTASLTCSRECFSRWSKRFA